MVASTYGQDRNSSLELNYPFAIGDNFFEFSYVGIVDVGFDYRIAEAGLVDLWIGFNTGIFKSGDRMDDPNLEVLAFDFKPALIVELNTPGIDKLHPAIGVGYNAVMFTFVGNNPVDPNANRALIDEETRGGINAHFRLAYDIAERWFVQAQYDFTKLSRRGDVPNISFNTNVNTIRIGVGLRI